MNTTTKANEHRASSSDGVRVAASATIADGTRVRLVAGRCDRCGLTAAPAPAQCPNCWGELAALPLSTTGSLYSYSVIHLPSPTRPAPYTVGYVDLPEGARVYAIIDETDEQRLAPEMKVELHLQPSEDGFVALWRPEGAGEER